MSDHHAVTMTTVARCSLYCMATCVRPHSTVLCPACCANRSKFRDMFLAHSTLTTPKNTSMPSGFALWMVFLASAIPFIAFGFLVSGVQHQARSHSLTPKGLYAFEHPTLQSTARTLCNGGICAAGQLHHADCGRGD